MNADQLNDNGLSRYLRNELTAGDLVNRSTISSVTILLTYQCPAACNHCIFESDIYRKEVVDKETARRFIEAAARQAPPPSLSFSGGEPFLQFEMMLELAAFAKSLGMPSELISSGAWAKTQDFARNRLARLQESGLRTYCMSVDRYHTPYVPVEKMRNALLAAFDLDLRIVLNTMVDPTTLGEEEDYLVETLQAPRELIQSCYINRLITAPIGRARSKVTDFLYQKKDFNEGCPFATEIVTLSPHGLVYPCCGMVLGEKLNKAGMFIQDSIEDKTVDEIAGILDDLKHDLFFRLLQAIGPYRLLNEVRRRRPELQLREDFVGSCDVCLEFTSNAAVAEAARELLVDYAHDLQIPVAQVQQATV